MYICFIVLLKWELAEVAMAAAVPEVLGYRRGKDAGRAGGITGTG